MTKIEVSIIDLTPGQDRLIKETAQLLYREFAGISENAWPSIENALIEVERSLGKGRISKIALIEGNVIGWIGGISQYDGNVYELHPLVVDSLHQHKGVGSALIRAFEDAVWDRGGITIWLGSDDENGQTSISGIDLYPDVLNKLASIQVVASHPYEFYLKNGFSIVGVLPDANGIGKPDIYMAKRVSASNHV